MIIDLHVCCNNPGNGLFAYQAPSLSILDLELEAQNWRWPPRFVELNGAIRLSGKTWPIVWSKEYVGNWAWNAYRIGDTSKTPGWSMVDFLIWLRRRDLYHANTGPSELFDWFNGDRYASPAAIHGWLGDAWEHDRQPRRRTEL